MTRPVSLLICALGGEGGGVLTEWLVETARHAGFAAQATSIPGVAQRTGATTYYLEVFPVPLSELGGRRPVFSLNPVPGALDAMVSSELLETARQIGNGMPSPERTLVITSSGRTLTTHERMQPGDGRTDTPALLKLVERFSREHHVFDMGAVAQECGTVVSAVMLGAIAGSGLFPFSRADYEAVAGRSGASAAASLKGFAAAFDIVRAAAAHGGGAVTHGGGTTTSTAPQAESPQPRHAGLDPASIAAHNAPQAESPQPRHAGLDPASIAAHNAPQAVSPQPRHAGLDPASIAAHNALPDRDAISAEFPVEVQDIARLGHARLTDYQGAAYAQLYLKRLHDVLAAERSADPEAQHAFATTRETARWLALWMAFDDIVRVADLKSRASRWARVQREVKAGDDDLLKLYDHFKPGVPEFAALLPAPLAARLLAWERRRVAAGRQAWALPLKVGTHGVTGMLALRMLASLKWLRVRGSRYAQEQRMIEQWLGCVAHGTQRGWHLGHEIAQCGRLIKGYGATNERGKDNLLHVLGHLATLETPQAATAAVAAARAAALGDDAGKALDAALRQHGAPPRPVKEQPIRFIRRPQSVQPKPATKSDSTT